MSVSISQLLHKLDDRIRRFIKDDGILDSEDQEVVWQKAKNILSLMKYIIEQNKNNSNLLPLNEIVKSLKRIVKLMQLGELAFDSKQQISDYFKKIRIYIKGIKLSFELVELSSDEDIPESVYEAYEPSIDPETGECEDPTDLSFHGQVLSLYQLHKSNHTQAPGFSEAVDSLTSQMETLSLKINTEFQTDLGDGLKGIADPRRALYAELQAMREATQRYFEPTHLAATAEVARVAQAFYEKEASVTTNLCAGSLVIAASEALRSVSLLNDNREAHEAELKWQGVSLSIQRKPSRKNLGNLFIRNVGCYGHRKEGKRSKFNILDDFEEVAKYSGKTCLKQVIAEYGASPGQITREMLSLPETLNGENILKKFKQNLFLIFCAEIFRYFPVEEASTNYVKQLPFAIALSMGLEMLCSGEIELEDLFDHDADLGLPTGVKILDNAQSVGIKFKNLLTQYQQYLEDLYPIVGSFKRAFPHGKVVCTEEQHTLRLQNSFGKH